MRGQRITSRRAAERRAPAVGVVELTFPAGAPPAPPSCCRTCRSAVPGRPSSRARDGALVPANFGNMARSRACRTPRSRCIVPGMHPGGMPIGRSHLRPAAVRPHHGQSAEPKRSLERPDREAVAGYEVLRKRARLIAVVTFIGVLGGLARSWSLPPATTASGEVKLLPRASLTPNRGADVAAARRGSVPFAKGAERTLTPARPGRGDAAQAPGIDPPPGSTCTSDPRQPQDRGDRRPPVPGHLQGEVAAGPPAVDFLSLHLHALRAGRRSTERCASRAQGRVPPRSAQERRERSQRRRPGAGDLSFAERRSPARGRRAHSSSSRHELETRRAELVVARAIQLEGELAAEQAQLKSDRPAAQTKFQHSESYRTSLADVNRKLSEAYRARPQRRPPGGSAAQGRAAAAAGAGQSGAAGRRRRRWCASRIRTISRRSGGSTRLRADLVVDARQPGRDRPRARQAAQGGAGSAARRAADDRSRSPPGSHEAAPHRAVREDEAGRDSAQPRQGLGRVALRHRPHLRGPARDAAQCSRLAGCSGCLSACSWRRSFSPTRRPARPCSPSAGDGGIRPADDDPGEARSLRGLSPLMQRDRGRWIASAAWVAMALLPAAVTGSGCATTERPFVWVHTCRCRRSSRSSIGPRDTISVDVRNQAALSGEFVVGDGGDYRQPTLGTIHVDGKTAGRHRALGPGGPAAGAARQAGGQRLDRPLAPGPRQRRRRGEDPRRRTTWSAAAASSPRSRPRAGSPSSPTATACSSSASTTANSGSGSARAS